MIVADASQVSALLTLAVRLWCEAVGRALTLVRAEAVRLGEAMRLTLTPMLQLPEAVARELEEEQSVSTEEALSEALANVLPLGTSVTVGDWPVALRVSVPLPNVLNVPPPAEGVAHHHGSVRPIQSQRSTSPHDRSADLANRLDSGR